MALSVSSDIAQRPVHERTRVRGRREVSSQWMRVGCRECARNIGLWC